MGRRIGQTFERVSGSTSHIALLAIVEDQSVDVFVVYICDPRSVAVAVKPNQTPLTKKNLSNSKIEEYNVYKKPPSSSSSSLSS